MAFTELSTSLSVPGELITLFSASQASRNYAVQNLDIGEDDIQPWGYLIARIYIPDPIFEVATVLSHACYGRTELLFNVMPDLGSLNLQWCFYATKNDQASNVRLWVE